MAAALDKYLDIEFVAAVLFELDVDATFVDVLLALLLEDYYPAYTKEDGTKVTAINGESHPQGEAAEYTISDNTYVSSPSTTEWLFSDGITVTNGNSKSYTTGKENGIKYSSGVKYTIHLPEDFRVEKAIFAGYDNYSEADSYIQECNGTTYSQTQYVYPKKDSSGNYTWTTHELTFGTPATGTLTFTPGGKQVVWVITLKGIVGGAPAILLGDVNEDGTITITDVTTTVDYVLGKSPMGFNFTNADVNQNGSIEVTDITLIVDIILRAN